MSGPESPRDMRRLQQRQERRHLRAVVFTPAPPDVTTSTMTSKPVDAKSILDDINFLNQTVQDHCRASGVKRPEDL